MELRIEHRTHYHYDKPLHYSIQQLRLTPQNGFGQQVKHWDVRVNGSVTCYADTFGNISHTLVVDAPHNDITITATGRVQTGLYNICQEHSLPLPVYLRSTDLTHADSALTAFASTLNVQKSGLQERNVYQIMQAIHDAVPYQGDMPQNKHNAAQAFALGASSSHDYAHIFIACCRRLGIPTRYVSGYLFLPKSGSMINHGWVDVWLADAGWYSFDVASGQRANGVHVRLATGLDYKDACPIHSALQHSTAAQTISALAA